MSERRFFKIWLQLIAGILLLTGCQNGDDQLLVTIEGRDTISVSQFKMLLEKKYRKTVPQLSYFEKRKYLEAEVQERLKLVYAKENGLDSGIHFDMEEERYNILLRHAYEKHIIGHFITEEYIELYKQHYGATISVKNIVIRFKDREGSSAKLTRHQAKRKADSVYTLIRENNFDAIAEKNSDYYTNPYSKKVNIIPDIMKVGQIPVNYEREILKLKPLAISHPIEIPGAFVIARLVDYDNATKQVIDRTKAEEQINARLNGEDYAALSLYQNTFMDSLYNSVQVRLVDANINYLIAKLSDTTRINLSFRGFDSAELERKLAEIGDVQLRIKDFFQRNPPGKMTSLKFDVASRIIKQQCKFILLAQLSMRDGFVASDAFLAELEWAKNKKILGLVNEQISKNIDHSSSSEIDDYFEEYRYRYQTEGSIVWSEIFSLSKDNINSAISALRSGTAFEKIHEIINQKNKNPDVKFTSNNTSAYTDRDPLIRIAQKMEINEISDVIPRKDGGYSIIKVVNKADPVLLPYEKIKNQVQGDYQSEMFRAHELRLSNQLRGRCKVVVYENNLKMAE